MVLALALILPVALAVAGATLTRPDPAEGVRAVVVRQGGDALDVVLAGPDGQERLLRHLNSDDLGLWPGYAFQEAGSLGPDGWLAVFADSMESPDYTRSRTVFLDLADPATPPIVLPGNGFIGPRWGPDGQAALVCGPDCAEAVEPVYEGELPATRSVRVLDLDEGTESILPAVPLHDGTSEPIWSADGTGFLAQLGAGEWGITPLDGGPALGPTPEIDSRRLRLVSEESGGARLADALEIAQSWLRGALAPAIPVAALAGTG